MPACAEFRHGSLGHEDIGPPRHKNPWGVDKRTLTADISTPIFKIILKTVVTHTPMKKVL